MKNIMMVFSSMMILTSFAIAETHGGVITANEQMKAVSNYAVGSGSDLYRVLKIQKQNGSDMFTISYGGMNSNGKESISDKEVVRATVVASDGTERTVKVEHVSGVDFSN